MNWQLFGGFLVLTTLVLIAPGPIVTLLISTGATRGVRAALVTVAGTSTGNALLLIGIASGLSWVLTHAVYVFEVLRWAGAAYLIYLGVRAWRSAGREDPLLQTAQVHFWRGLTVAVSNPKGIAFYSAFLPQFVDPALPAARQLVVMCVCTIVMGGLNDCGWAIASGLGRSWFMKSSRARFLGRASGCTLIGGGIWLSLARRPLSP